MKNRHYLAPIFEPESVAVIGASTRSNSIGAVLLANLIEAGFGGRLYAVNPKYERIGKVPCFRSIDAVPEAVDLAVIAAPRQSVPDVIEGCGRAGVRGAIVITAGFSEAGAEGQALEAALVANARRYGLRVIGPNCLGVMRPDLGFNATFARGTAVAGALALVSQSGAVCTALVDWARARNIGFSSVVSLGGSADLDFGEILDYLASDARTEHILAYVEGIRDARRFMTALRAAARVKPVILMKVGRHPAGSRAAQSHTGALVGADDVFDAAVRRTGAVRVVSIGELVAAAQALAAHVRPSGDRLAIITNGGGPAVMAADRAADLKLPLAELCAATLDTLKDALPATWSHGNPIDLIGDAGPERYTAAVNACLADANVDGLLVILTPQAMTDAAATAQVVIDAARGSAKPVLACWMGGDQVTAGRALLNAANIPTFTTPEPAVQMFSHVAAYFRNQKLMLEAPPPFVVSPLPDVNAARRVIDGVLASGRTLLNEIEAKLLLGAFHIPVVPTVLAQSAEQAAECAHAIGFPVVLKIHSPDITHKSDVGGVRLGLVDEAAVCAAFVDIRAQAHALRPDARIEGVTVQAMIRRPQARELILGVAHDRVFGPAISFGTGGIAVEVHADRAIALPPLNALLARELIAGTRAARMVGDFRGWPAVDHDALVAVLLRLSELVCELPEVRELDINPLLADAEGVIALDARVVVAPRSQSRRYAHLAIHPYPAELEREVRTTSGEPVLLRPIRPEDAAIEQAFVRALSPQSRYYRFMGSQHALSPPMLARFTQVDYDREMAFVAILNTSRSQRQIGVARYMTNPDGVSCEFAIAVADDYQGSGIACQLMHELIKRARSCDLERMYGHILAENMRMIALAQRLGFDLKLDPEDGAVLRAERDLR